MITKNEISSLNLSPTKKDFVQIWNELIEVASKITERWDPTSTNESDPGIVLLKVLAGIADKLNYNIDKNILEAFMPTAAQMESMQKLCELVGYDIKYYQSAETKVRISYIGNNSDSADESDEGFGDGIGLPIPKFTTITNADKDITFVTTNQFPVYITKNTPWVEVSCIEGQISQCESTNDNNLITLAQLDDSNRYYLPETQIAENGIFVYNAATSAAGGTAVTSDGEHWTQVSNLNVQATGSRVYKFGYDSREGRPYLAFPDDVGSLIGDGLFIYFVRTSGLSGNISPRTLEVLEIPTDEAWANYSAEQFEVVNVDATTNGANIENISTAYNNFKKTIGTFDTLVTCRDYMNKIYSLMEAGNSPYVSNILVTDIRNDINKAITLCSFNEFGILYKEQPLLNGDNKPLIDHFELLLYPFKTFTQVHHSTDDLVSSYNTSFTYTNQKNSEIVAMLDDVKMCAHMFADPSVGDLVAINNYLQLNALIATSTRVSEAEANDILKNVKVALVNEFNMRNLDFGEEIPFESILSVIENADARIKVVSLQDPILLTTYSVKEETTEGNTTVSTSKEYGIASTAPDFVRIKGVSYDVDIAKEIYNKLVLRNVLAGRAALFKYNDTFLASNSEQPYTITRDVTTEFAANESIHTAIETLIEARAEGAAASESVLDGIRGSNNGVLTLRVYPESEARITGRQAYAYAYTDSEGATQYFFYNIYETYEYDFTASPATISPADGDDAGVTPAMYRLTRGSGVRSGAATPANATSGGVIKDIKEVKATCKINSATNVFNDIKLAKNEVIKFRAPNLITTKTFPAYVYYNYTKGNGATSDTTRATADNGSYATVQSLKTFISKFGTEPFLSKLCETNRSHLVQLNFERDPSKLDESNRLPDIFNAAIVIFHTTENGTIDKIISSKGDLREYLNSLPATETEETFYYYPLNSGTLNAWRTCIRDCYEETYSKSLPDGNILWRLSSTYSHPQGRLVINTHQKLLEVTGDHLASMSVGDEVYICIAYGQESKFYTIPENGDVQLESGDKLYIHYTPSSTNEDGETENAEPVSIVYEGGNTGEPVILRPSGFTLMPSEDVNRQGTSWKKTNVNFGSETVNLLALAPNEQIELRSISKVVLNTPARFYKNFDNEGLEKGTITEYELKDGEYIFYTNQSTQEAAYYGSGSVVTLSGGAYIPKTDGLKDVSQILTQGLHVAPWSSVIQLSDSRKVTITEYQYVTLIEGDTITSIIVDESAETANQINSAWKACNGAVYTSAGAASPSVLPDIELASGDGWEVCSRLELSTWPGQAQELRAVSTSSSPATFVGSTGLNSISVTCNSNAITFTDNDSSDVFSYSIENNIVKLRNSTTGEEVTEASITLSNGVPTATTYNSVTYSLSAAAEPDTTPVISDEIEVTTVTAAGNESSITIKPQQTARIDTTEFEPVSVKLNVIAQSASGNLGVEKVDDIADIAGTLMQMKVFKESPPALVELNNINEAITPISNKLAMSVDYSSESINNYWTKLDVGLAFHNNSNTRALSLNLLIPEESDLFGVFSVYLDTSAKLADGNGIPEAGARVFIDVPKELGTYNEVISIYNNGDAWWSSGIDQDVPNRLYLRAGLNCIKVLKSCNLLIKAEANASGNILYDNMQLVEGINTNGVNLKLIDFDAVSITEDTTKNDVTRANELLEKITELDPGHEFYYNVPVEDSLAIEFDQVVNSFSNPHTLYDINNVNNSFVISKLDVAYLDSGLKIARSSRYNGV